METLQSILQLSFYFNFNASFDSRGPFIVTTTFIY